MQNNIRGLLPKNNIPLIHHHIEDYSTYQPHYYHMYPKLKTRIISRKNFLLVRIARMKPKSKYINLSPVNIQSTSIQLETTTTFENIYDNLEQEQEQMENNIDVELRVDANTLSLLHLPLEPPTRDEQFIDEIPEPSSQYQSRIHTNYYIEISHDFGESWREPTTSPPKNCQISTLAKTPDGKYQVSAGVYDSIYNSEDYGETWIKAKNQPQIRRWTSISISNDGSKREATMDDGTVYFSLDYGNNWEKL